MLPFYVTKSLLSIKNEISFMTLTALDYNCNTTLNHKYSLFETLIVGNLPKIQYFGIGINGCRYDEELNSLVPYIPNAMNMDLYQPIPFRCVPISNDLTEIERANYRMRVQQNIGGVEYYCYYLKLIEFTTPNTILTETDIKTGDETVITLDNAFLNPVPNELSSVGILDVYKEGNAYVEGNLVITGVEVMEAITVFYNGDITKALISEIGLYSGQDKEVVVDITYTESIYTQLAIHKCQLPQDFSDINTVETSNIRLINNANFVI